jgi:hypothetical protein
MGTGSFLGVKSGRDVTLTPHPFCAVVKKEYSYTSTPPMGRTAFTEPQCLYKGALYLFIVFQVVQTWLTKLVKLKSLRLSRYCPEFIILVGSLQNSQQPSVDPNAEPVKYTLHIPQQVLQFLYCILQSALECYMLFVYLTNFRPNSFKRFFLLVMLPDRLITNGLNKLSCALLG